LIAAVFRPMFVPVMVTVNGELDGPDAVTALMTGAAAPENVATLPAEAMVLTVTTNRTDVPTATSVAVIQVSEVPDTQVTELQIDDVYGAALPYVTLPTAAAFEPKFVPVSVTRTAEAATPTGGLILVIIGVASPLNDPPVAPVTPLMVTRKLTGVATVTSAPTRHEIEETDT